MNHWIYAKFSTQTDDSFLAITNMATVRYVEVLPDTCNVVGDMHGVHH
jgi:hypothetical protein